eukprot:CAMPEP_0181394972 /NCGR_PEP_ID=MMETSP1106-20121128/28073_1 /TAXON_ID=81844 /ORGANISM="Mantoniella antarctica, Strain SL-175" /LENGTH=81 /DNA_ID=CAMNT_0023516525 /DNA_START=381 /DNA_END=626 /DNA_ORIENTATION=-
MKVLMFTKGQKQVPIYITSHHVSSNFFIAPATPFPSKVLMVKLKSTVYVGKRTTCPSITFLAAARAHTPGPTSVSITPRAW